MLEESELYFREVLDRKQRLDPRARRRTTVLSMDSLALVLKCRSQLKEAEELLSRALKMRRSICHELDMDLLSNKDRLASVYVLIDRSIARAMPLAEEALDGWRQLVRLEPSTRTKRQHYRSLAMMARFLQMDARLDEAEDSNREALRLCTEAVGSSHPDAWDMKYALAVLLAFKISLLGEECEAQLDIYKREVTELLRSVVKGRHSQLGEDHSQTLRSKKTLASFLGAASFVTRDEPRKQAGVLNVESANLLWEVWSSDVTTRLKDSCDEDTNGFYDECDEDTNPVDAAISCRSFTQIDEEATWKFLLTLGRRFKDEQFMLALESRLEQSETEWNSICKLKKQILGPVGPASVIAADLGHKAVRALPNLVSEARRQ
eukprot:TRINITY_DN11732_c0_g1_i2.p1 TRINITY_DN11732_c0_g1~~TRINITY_DN11732_c0_g1_i2.p1  ORF type:complete len:377 (+),score=47.70 TRINITY_DN11732_c0_g1_i2:159-1289(+)